MHKRLGLIDSNISFSAFNYSLADTQQPGFVDFNSIAYNGTYGRSLSLGNNQDLSLQSNFNLQLEGYVLDSVRIEAAVTDNNIPFQPDGNTRQIQEFDQIFITFEKGKYKLTAGDYNLKRPNSYFVDFNKRVQGLMFQSDFGAKGRVKHKFGLSGSLAKGQFARNIIQGIEGNQGPYKLSGNNGEQFFVVLAASESVYIDGVQLERGEDRDYVINYNTGEVSFMPRQLITKDKRIQVEFEYQDRNYLNTLFYGYDEIQVGKKWNFRMNFYSNQDARNQPFTQTLSAAQKQYLAGIGDRIEDAYYQSIQPDTFAANKILYKIVDTTVGGIHYDSVFVYTTNPDSAQYNLGFSYVGERKGNYVISGANTNGRSYSWVAPTDGIPSGSYEPVVLLITPKMHQMFTLGSTYQIDSLKQISVELSASQYDPNLFSGLDRDQHWGGAGRLVYDELRFFGRPDSMGRKGLSWKNQLTYEYVQHTFKAIAPYRNVEFARDWNIPVDAPAEEEHLAGFSTELKKGDGIGIQYALNWYQRGSDYTANRNVLVLLYQHKLVKSGATFNLMHAQSPVRKSNYWRPSAFLERTFPAIGGITIGTRYEVEKNDLRHAVSDSLLSAAFSFNALRFYIRTAAEKKTKLELNYTLRNDDSIRNNQFTPNNSAHTIDAALGLYQWANHQISLTGAYRKLMIRDEQTQQSAESGEGVLGRLEYNGTLAKGFLVPSLLYEIGTGQEQKREYTYIEVPAGQGIYMWNDYNGDGVQQANEFEMALYPDQRKYIRIMTPTNEYVKVHYVTLNHSLQLSPDHLWTGKEKKTWQKLAGRFTDQLSLQISNRVLAGAGLYVFNPFSHNFEDSSVIANLTSISNTLFFNRNSAVWGLDYTYAYNSGKTLLTYGLEGNNQWNHSGKFRWTFARAFTANLHARSGIRGLNSALADDGRTYSVRGNMAEPSLTWLLQSSLRITGSFKYDDRVNKAEFGGERALIQSANLDSRLSLPNWGTLQARATYAHISYNGKPNTSLSFVMLDALQNGTNWLWYLNWERRISKGIEISLEYEGRKPGANAVIHTGRMSIRAIL